MCIYIYIHSTCIYNNGPTTCVGLNQPSKFWSDCAPYPSGFVSKHIPCHRNFSEKQSSCNVPGFQRGFIQKKNRVYSLNETRNPVLRKSKTSTTETSLRTFR